MDDPRVAIWNTLHDGEITVIRREEPGKLVMFVSIPYLRERITPLGDSFCLRLRGFRSIELAEFEGTAKTSDIAEIANAGLEILSTDTEKMPVRVAITT